MSLVDHIHAMLGRLGQDPVGPPGVVVVVPDDYIPRRGLQEGIFALDVAAGGAGFRSEALFDLIFGAGLSGNVCCELSEMYIYPVTANAGFEAVWVDAAAGFTLSQPFSADRSGGLPNLGVQKKNSAAATAAAATIFTGLTAFSINAPLPVPGRILLRGGSPESILIIRPLTDNQRFSVWGRWRMLEQRSL